MRFDLYRQISELEESRPLLDALMGELIKTIVRLNIADCNYPEILGGIIVGSWYIDLLQERAIHATQLYQSR